MADYLNTSTTFWAMYESNPDVGSSQKNNDGLVSTSQAKARRFISPPDMPLTRPGTPTRVLAHFVRPNSWKKNNSQTYITSKMILTPNL